jgi:sugar phosphate isomerase/epimerase
LNTGFITNSLTGVGIKDINMIAAWAADNGFSTLEIGPVVPLDEKSFDAVLSSGKISFSAFIYCRNFLSGNAEEAENHKSNLRQRIRLAKKFGIKKVICTTGVKEASFSLDRPEGFQPEASIDASAEFIRGFIDEAEKNNVNICFENCPTMGNIAISPYIWDMLFEKIDSKRVGLVYDPSHLVWQFIEPYDIITRYRERIFHVHGKDCELDLQSLGRTGILHHISLEKESANFPHGNRKNLWWRYRLPGLGDLDWSKIVSRFYEIGYAGTISIEHEDPVWSGSEEKVKTGLMMAKKHIAQYLACPGS